MYSTNSELCIYYSLKALTCYIYPRWKNEVKMGKNPIYIYDHELLSLNYNAKLRCTYCKHGNN